MLDDTLNVDLAPTQKLRADLRAARLALKTIEEDDGYRRTAVSKHRICRLNPQDAKYIDAMEGELVELDSQIAAPLRAWLVVDPDTAEGTVPLDGAGRKMLMLGMGDRVIVRRLGPGKPSAA